MADQNKDERLLRLEVGSGYAGARLDFFLSKTTDLTRSAAARLTEEESVFLNEKIAKKNDKLTPGDIVTVELPEPEPSEALPEAIPLDIVYEDDDLIVINKPSGMVVHPAVGNPSGTLVNALLYHCGETLSGVGGVIRPGIVHRIDKDTTGLLVAAKNDSSHLFLSEQLKGHHINRIYTAIAVGNLREDEGTVNAPIGRHPTERKKMAVIQNRSHPAREAITHWKVLARGECDGQAFTLLRCELETGRTHQIRVHLASIGHPILGDGTYGGNRTRFEEKHHTLIDGQCLHAGELSFIHPKTKKAVTFRAPLPENMTEIIRKIFKI